jgi:hypothetical protein
MGPEPESQPAQRVEPLPRAASVARDGLAEAGVSSATDAGRVLALQRAIGNAGVQRLLRDGRLRRPPRRSVARGVGAGGTLQRFVGWEHERIGNKGSMPACNDPDPSKCPAGPTVIEVAPGVRLTWGQIVALAGDEFETVEELIDSATLAGGGGSGGDPQRGRLRAAMHHDLDFRPSGTNDIPANLYEGGDPAAQAQSKAFQELALHNLAHFPDRNKAQDAWIQYHNRAVVEALEAGWTSQPARVNKAYLYEAFGEHFLTDCFSAGHIRTPRTAIYEWYRQAFADRAMWGLEYWLLLQYIAHPVIAPDHLKTLLTAFEEPLKKGLAALRDQLFALIAGAVSGTIHDYEGDQGVLVTAVALGNKQWVTYGDNTLPGAPGRDAAKTSGQAEQLAVLAIELAKNHVDTAYAVGQQLATNGVAYSMTEGYKRLAQRGVTYPFNDVMNFVPHAVAPAAQAPWSAWRWGTFTPWFYKKVNDYALDKIKGNVGALQPALDRVPDDNIAPDGQAPFNPRQFLKGQLSKFTTDPVGTIGEMTLWSALDPQYGGVQPAAPPVHP